MQPSRVEPGPGQESVWDYPRPPAVEASTEHIRVVVGGEVVADSHRTIRVLETSQAPAYYVPPADVRLDLLELVEGHSTVCEWKGAAAYWTVTAGGVVCPAAGWSYPDPVPAFAAIREHLAFYPQRVDACFVDDEQVGANGGDFYGGWITSKVVGPFKGEAGTQGW